MFTAVLVTHAHLVDHGTPVNRSESQLLRLHQHELKSQVLLVLLVALVLVVLLRPVKSCYASA